MSRLTHALSWGRLLLVMTLIAAALGAIPAISAVSDREGIAALEATQTGFRAVQKKIGPAVVTVYSTTRVNASMPGMNPFEDFFGIPRSSQVRNVSGSGVIIRPEGIVLTNSHVVENATKVTVQLPNSDKKLPAQVVQTDSRTDLAVVRITEKGTYPTAPLGDANSVQVGDWAIAFGSPYGLPSTMTVGVISATGRKLEGPEGDFDYYNLLQTDASINHGNSGGPLVNINGEVIGVNFMIFSPGEDSGSIGIGFAIPINTFTKRIIETLVAGRAPERGLIGIQIGALDDAKRQEFGIPTGGVLVQNVIAGKAGEKAGMKDEDVIVEFNGVKITDPDQFINLVQQTAPGTRVPVTVIREKKPVQLTVVLENAQPQQAANTGPDKSGATAQKLGFTVATLTPALAQRYNLPLDKGVLVTRVEQGSPAQDANLTPGTIILRVGDTEVATADQFWSVLDKKMAGAKFGVVMRIRRGDNAETITLQQPAEEPK